MRLEQAFFFISCACPCSSLFIASKQESYLCTVGGGQGQQWLAPWREGGSSVYIYLYTLSLDTVKLGINHNYLSILQASPLPDFSVGT